jgi:hypothetical protein
MTKEQIEQLLLPRYKVIADWPNSLYKIGEVLVGADCIVTKKGIKELTDFPHLFKRLEWWEQRTEEEMPKYIRIKEYVWEVKWKEWLGEYRPTAPLDYSTNRPKGYEIFTIHWHFDKDISLPITEAEFINQQNLNNGQ